MNMFEDPMDQTMDGIKRGVLGFLVPLAFLVATLGVVAVLIAN